MNERGSNSLSSSSVGLGGISDSRRSRTERKQDLDTDRSAIVSDESKMTPRLRAETHLKGVTKQTNISYIFAR